MTSHLTIITSSRIRSVLCVLLGHGLLGQDGAEVPGEELVGHKAHPSDSSLSTTEAFRRLTPSRRDFGQGREISLWTVGDPGRTITG